MATTAPGSEIAIAPRGELAPGRLRCVGCGAAQDARGPVMRADPESRPFDLYRCGACGLVQQHPREPAERLAALYGERHRAVAAEDEPACWARAVQQYVVHVLPHEAPRYQRLLDVGCGLGHFAALAAQHGWQVVGLDGSAEAVSSAAGRFGLDFRAGSLAQHSRTLPPFDVVVLGGLIEHLPEPAAFLHEVRRILAPGGVACLDTPNWGGRWRRWGGSRWLGLDRRHVNLFDADSLTRTLRTCGFEQIETGGYTPYRRESWAVRPEVQHFVRKLPGFIARRLNRYFDRRAARSPWAILRSDPPATLEAALRLLGDLASPASPSATPGASGLRADALTAAARRL